MTTRLITTPSRRNAASTSIVQATLACVLAFGACVTNAAGSSEPSVRVYYTDLDLSTPAGIDALRSRIARAAYQVCSKQRDASSAARKTFQECIRAASNNAYAQVMRPRG